MNLLGLIIYNIFQKVMIVTGDNQIQMVSKMWVHFRLCPVQLMVNGIYLE